MGVPSDPRAWRFRLNQSAGFPDPLNCFRQCWHLPRVGCASAARDVACAKIAAQVQGTAMDAAELGIS